MKVNSEREYIAKNAQGERSPQNVSRFYSDKKENQKRSARF